MSVIGCAGVWALGDCAWIPMKPAADLKDKFAWYPPTAQHAIREGPRSADTSSRRCAGCRPNRSSTVVGRWRRSARVAASPRCRRDRADRLPRLVLVRTYYLLRLPGLDAKCASRSTGRSG